MHNSTRGVRMILLGLAVGSVCCGMAARAGAEPGSEHSTQKAKNSGSEASTSKSTSKSGAGSADAKGKSDRARAEREKAERAKAERIKAEQARAGALAEACRHAEAGVKAAMEQASASMRQAVYGFYEGTDTEAATMTDDQVAALAETAKARIGAAATGAFAALEAVHARAQAEAAAAGGAGRVAERMNAAFDSAKSRLGNLVSTVERVLGELRARAMRANDGIGAGEHHDAQHVESSEHVQAHH